MARFRYVKRGVKRQHSIIEWILPIFEQIAKIEEIKKVTLSDTWHDLKDKGYIIRCIQNKEEK